MKRKMIAIDEKLHYKLKLEATRQKITIGKFIQSLLSKAGKTKLKI